MDPLSSNQRRQLQQYPISLSRIYISSQKNSRVSCTYLPWKNVYSRLSTKYLEHYTAAYHTKKISIRDSGDLVRLCWNFIFSTVVSEKQTDSNPNPFKLNKSWNNLHIANYNPACSGFLQKLILGACSIKISSIEYCFKNYQLC